MRRNPPTTALQPIPLQPFGVEVKGFDIQAASASELTELKQLLAWHGVLVLRGVGSAAGRSAQDADAGFVDFLKRLGPLTFTVGETPVAHQPMLNVVSNVGRTTPPKSVFHTDTSYVRQPPAYTALRPVMLPAAGGETVFSNQFQAFDTLPANVKRCLASAQVLHTVSGLPTTPALTPRSELDEQWHPLFKVHPLSGLTSLFLSTPQRCRAVSDMSADQAARAIRLLYRHSTRHHRLYHHKWQANDLLIWDNRCTMHRGDHSGVVGGRVFHRGMVLPHD